MAVASSGFGPVMSGCLESNDSQREKLGRQVVCASRGTSAGHLPSTRAYPAHWIAKRGHSRARARACTGPARIEVAYFGAIGGGVHVHTRRLGLLWGGRALVRLPQTVSTGTSGAYCTKGGWKQAGSNPALRRGQVDVACESAWRAGAVLTASCRRLRPDIGSTRNSVFPLQCTLP